MATWWLATTARQLWGLSKTAPETEMSAREQVNSRAVPVPVGQDSEEGSGSMPSSSVLGDAVTSATFTINGTSHTVPGTLKFKLTLNEYLRNHVGLTGTKVMCAEGGCGSCVVMATFTDAATRKRKSLAINSCLCLVYSIDGWAITTVEGIGSQSTGFHPVQARIAEYNGSQCGFCTPGMVMSMYSLLQAEPQPNSETVEKAFGGNLCRCTGYRPIMDAMKSFATDADPTTTPTGCIDIEDLGKHGCCGCCEGTGSCRRKPEKLMINAEGGQWYRPTTLSDLFLLLDDLKLQPVRMIAGNTSVGVYNENNSTIYIDIKTIPELHTTTVSTDLVRVGGNVTLTTLKAVLEEAAKLDGYGYCQTLADHITVVASVPVRNAGTIAGNLMMKHVRNDFLSDMFVLLEVVGAKLTISSLMSKSDFTPAEFLKQNMSQKVIEVITFPSLGPNVHVRSFKPMPRAENAHALVNAAFQIEIDSSYRVTSIPSLVFGGIRAEFIHASGTENYLFNKQLIDSSVLQGTLMILEAEIQPDNDPLLASPEYRRSLAIGLFYKTILGLCKPEVSARLASGSEVLHRPLSSGKQDFSTDKSKWPLTKPVSKLSAKLQASGEAKFMDDMPLVPGELHAAFVLTTEGNAFIFSIDEKEALKVPGVVRFITALDIPTGGENNFSPGSSQEEVLCSGHVLYAGQPLGIIVAVDRQVALDAAELVSVTYRDVKKPILTIEEAQRAGSYFTNPAQPITKGDPDKAIGEADRVIEGEVSFKTQYHFNMETQSCRVVPTEDGLDVFPTTQGIDYVQQAVATVLNMNASDVRCEVKRLGGGFGSKITRNNLISAACALSAHVVKRPVRMVLDLPTNMKAIGKRCPYSATYKVGVTSEGVLKSVIVEYAIDCGSSPNDNSAVGAQEWADNAYFCENWRVSSKLIKTNVPSTTWTRAPGSVPAIYIMETIMEHVAKELNKDPLAYRELNLYKKDQLTHLGMPLTYCNVRELVSRLSDSAHIQTRKAEITAFNKANRWKKHGLGTVPVKYGAMWSGIHYNVLVSVHHGAGSVSISHGGIEMGQGINTKVAQVAAYILGIDIGLITIRPSADHQNANSSSTGGSTTSELCCLGVKQSCEELLARMAAIRAEMGDPDWPSLVNKCFSQGVDLTARKWVVTESDYVYRYNVYGVTFTELELDVLTGESIVTRADILYDAGESMSPQLDIGQVEGAFVMGLGYWRSEDITYDELTGENLTHNTWTYKPPVWSDTPVDFRVALLRDAPNPIGVLRSKLVSEPPMCMTCSALFALKDAIQAAREDVGVKGYFVLGGPGTVEVAQTMCLPDITNYVLTE